MTRRNVKAALVQHPPVFLNLPRTLAKVEALTEECAAGGADIVVFPETWLTGYPVWLDEAPKAALWDYPPAKRLYQYLTDNSLGIPGPEFAKLQETARKNGVYLVIGVHERSGGTLYNTILYLAPDGTSKTHRKLTPTYTERLVWGAGDGSGLSVLQTPFGVLGGLICWEHWMPLARAAMHAKGEDIHISQFPTVRELHQIASRHYAFEGQCFVLTSGCVLTKSDVMDGFTSLGIDDREVFELLDSMDKDLLQRGGSAAIAPDAGYLAGPVYDEKCILYAELDLDLVKQGHLLMDSNGHYSRPDIFELKVNEKRRQNVTFSDTE